MRRTYPSQPQPPARRVSAAALVVAMLLPAPHWVFARPRAAAVNPLAKLQVVEAAETTVITVIGQRAPTFSTFRLEAPPRLFVDIPGGDVSSLSRSIPVSNGVIERVEAMPYQRSGVNYGRVVVTFTREALFHVRVDGTAVVIVVDGTERRLSKAQSAAIAAAKSEAQNAAKREQQLLQTLRDLRKREQDAAVKRTEALAQQSKLRGELDRLRKDGASKQQALADMARRVAEAKVKLTERDQALTKIKSEATSLRSELRRERASLANAVAQRRAEEARIALLREQIAKERKALGQRDKGRIKSLEAKLTDARAQADNLRRQVKLAREARRTAQAEEVLRLKAQIKGQAQELATRLKAAGQKQTDSQREIERLRSALLAEKRALKTQQALLGDAKRADTARANAEKKWRLAEARAEKAALQLAERTKQLERAQAAMAQISKQQAAARARTKQISALLTQRESELQSARQQLQQREKSLQQALKSAIDRERAARDSGRKAEATVAAKQRAELETARRRLAMRLSEQQSSLDALRSQAKANAKARAVAEDESAKLRAALAKRERDIAKWRNQASRNAATERKVKALDRQAAQLREKLRQQAQRRDAQLDKIESASRDRIAQVKRELRESQNDKIALEKSLAAMQLSAKRATAAHKKQLKEVRTELSAQKELLKQAQRDIADSRKRAAAAMERAQRVAKLLSAREASLGEMKVALKKRDSVLAKELKRITAAERSAAKAGRRQEAVAAQRLKAQLNRERASLKTQLAQQNQALQAAKGAARANAKARATAEKEVASLRSQLTRRAKALESLRKSSDSKARATLAKRQREFDALKLKLSQQLRQRDARLATLEKSLSTKLSAARDALTQAKSANESLESKLATSRERLAQETKRAAQISELLSQREREFKQLQGELAKRKREVSAALAKAKEAERKAQAAGRSQEAAALAKERAKLESSLGQVRSDLKSSQSALNRAKAEGLAHEQARLKSEAKAAKLAESLASREAELARLKRTSGKKASKALQAAQVRVKAAKLALRTEREARASQEKRFKSQMQRQLAKVRADMERRAQSRLTALQRAHEEQLKEAQRSAREAATASALRSQKVQLLLSRRERELQQLKQQTTAQLAELQRALDSAKQRAKTAKRSGKRREAKLARHLVKDLALKVKQAKRLNLARAAALTRAAKQAAKERRAREAAERRAADLSKQLTQQVQALSGLRADRRSSSQRIAAAENRLKATQRKLMLANAKLDERVKQARERLLGEIKRVKADFAARERALRAELEGRERALRTALAEEQARRKLAERSAQAGAGGASINSYLERQQNRIAILEGRAAREREARERADQQRLKEREQTEAVRQQLARFKQRRQQQSSEAEIQRRAAKLAAKMVADAKRREAEEEEARQAAERRARIRQQAAVERERSRGVAAKVPMAEIRDVKITAEGYHRGQVALPLKGSPRYEVAETNPRRLVLRLHGTDLPDRLQRVFDTRQLRGPMERVTVFRPQHQPGEARVVVDLLQPASNVISIRDDQLIWEFVRSGRRAPGPTQFAAGGSFGARAPQPMAPKGGVAGNPVGAGVNANPIKSPWRSERRYTGKRINLTIKDADIRHVLTFLAREGNVNIIAGPEVSGRVTFHLENIPWDLALDVILRARGLDYVRQSGVIRVSTLEKLKKEFDMAVERRKKLQEVKQLVVRIIPVNYGQARAMQAQVRTVLSKAGTVSVNARTNSLLIKDTEEHVAAVEEMVRKLDAQTPQVLVEARIVEASSNFSKEVGIQWGGNYAMSSVYGNETGLAFPSVVGVAGGADGGEVNVDGLTTQLPNYAVNLPAAVGAGSGGAIGLTLGSLGGAGNLNLRLSAAEQEGTVKIVSSPKVLTLDNKTAQIRQGISIPISVVSAQGVQTRFFNADLQLQVTPHITQDGNVLMNINITKNEPDFSNRAADGNPTITQREARTELLLGDGDTTVIGGIYTRSTSESVKKVPFFGSLPLIGGLFRSRMEEDKRTELLIFITPRIVNRAQAMRVGK